MMENVERNEESNEKEDKNFNVIVTYAENGQSFQTIAENIIVRKMNELIWNFFSTFKKIINVLMNKHR